MRLLILVNLLFFWLADYAQQMRHSAEISKRSCNECFENNLGKVVISKGKATEEPFTNIFQLSVKRTGDRMRYSTVSFISPDCLISARHSVDGREAIEFIEIRVSPSANKWVLLNKSDFKIFYYTERLHAFDADVAIIKITNTAKLKMIYKSHFRLLDTVDISLADSLHVAGYPSKKFAINSLAPDTMVLRVVAFKDAEYNNKKTMIGLPLCACPGDSGAPIWFKYKCSYFVIGIEQGNNAIEKGFTNNKLTTGVLLYKEIVSWISEVISGKAGDAFHNDE